jgi:hypothetical protein
MRFGIQDYLQDKIKRVPTTYRANSTVDFTLCHVSPAYLESDIIWKNLGLNQTIAKIKRFLLFVILLIISVLFITPSYALYLVNPMTNILVQVSFLKVMIATYLSPLMVIFVNTVILPYFIIFFTELEGYRRKSS